MRAFWIALGQDQCLSSRRRTGSRGCCLLLLASLAASGSNLRHQLRAFILNPDAPLAKRSSRCHISGDHCARCLSNSPDSSWIPASDSSASASRLPTRTVNAGWLCPWRQIARAPQVRRNRPSARPSRQDAPRQAPDPQLCLLTTQRATSIAAELTQHCVHHA